MAKGDTAADLLKEARLRREADARRREDRRARKEAKRRTDEKLIALILERDERERIALLHAELTSKEGIEADSRFGAFRGQLEQLWPHVSEHDKATLRARLEHLAKTIGTDDYDVEWAGL